MEKKQAQKHPFGLWLGVVLIAVGLLAVVNGIVSLTDGKQRLIAPGGAVTVELVDTPELRMQGLSGRESLSADAGMLFVFDEARVSNCFWMKDMQFSIDMVWLSESKEVVTVTPDVSPETYPSSFCPDAPAKYGLELKAGRAKELKIEAGKKLAF